MFNISVGGNRGFASLIWEVIGVGFNHSSLDLSVTIYCPLYTNNPSENMWDYYFQPIDNTNKIDYQTQHTSFTDRFIFYNMGMKRDLNKFYKDRIKVKEDILNEYYDFYQKHFLNKKVIGVHYRSTDIYTDFQTHKQFSDKFEKAPIEYYFNEIDKLEYDYIYLATDSNQIFTQFTARYPNVISCAKMRSNTDLGVHVVNDNKLQHGKEILLETLLLSKCDYLLHGQSNVAALVHIIEPELNFKNLDYDYK